MKTEERLGIFGGTFNPPHIGHVRALEAFRCELKLDRILVMPAGIPPHKKIAGSDNPSVRLKMARAAFENPGCGVEVSDYEISKPGPSYTVDTVEHFTRPGRRLFLLCGTDMFLTFENWRNFRRIFALATVVCMPRENSLREEISAKCAGYNERYSAGCIVLPGESIELSSTMLREMIRNGDDVSSLVPGAVLDVIRKERIYD